MAPSRGEIIVDEGAAHAITVGKKSLLVAGVRSVLGHFEAGDVVVLPRRRVLSLEESLDTTPTLWPRLPVRGLPSWQQPDTSIPGPRFTVMTWRCWATHFLR